MFSGLDEYEQIDSQALSWLTDSYSKLVVPPEIKTIYPLIAPAKKLNCGCSQNKPILP